MVSTYCYPSDFQLAARLISTQLISAPDFQPTQLILAYAIDFCPTQLISALRS
jgi:hypothetical protein